MGNCNLNNKLINVKKINTENSIMFTPVDENSIMITSNDYDKKKILSIKNLFISHNLLDHEKNIIIGIWNNPNKLNVLGNQGILINNHQKIYELIYGIISCDMVVLIFENNIKLVIYKDKLGILFLELTENKINYKKQISDDIIKKLIKINNSSPDLDLIFSLLSNK